MIRIIGRLQAGGDGKPRASGDDPMAGTFEGFLFT